jgi:hypothetical protein
MGVKPPTKASYRQRNPRRGKGKNTGQKRNQAIVAKEMARVTLAAPIPTKRAL